jgi:Holliday junction resolvasome RuvABC endonuclease subunit
MIRTAGIDLSLTATGVALSDGECHLVGRDGVTRMSIDQQIPLLAGLAHEITMLALRNDPVAVCIEGLDMSQSYGGQIERTVLWWDVVSRLRAMTGLTTYVAPSSQVKMYATGSGAAKKGAVVEAITRRWPQFDHRGDDNAADAAACALIAAHMIGAPIGAPGVDGASYLPATHTRALRSVRPIDVAPPAKKRANRRVD